MNKVVLTVWTYGMLIPQFCMTPAQFTMV